MVIFTQNIHVEIVFNLPKILNKVDIGIKQVNISLNIHTIYSSYHIKEWNIISHMKMQVPWKLFGLTWNLHKKYQLWFFKECLFDLFFCRLFGHSKYLMVISDIFKSERKCVQNSYKNRTRKTSEHNKLIINN